MGLEEEEDLLQERLHMSTSEKQQAAKRLTRRFVFISLCFSWLLGCLISVLGLASSEFGVRLGGFTNGSLYFTYTFFNFFSPFLLKKFGCRWSFVVGQSCYMLYLVASILPRYFDFLFRTLYSADVCICSSKNWFRTGTIL